MGFSLSYDQVKNSQMNENGNEVPEVSRNSDLTPKVSKVSKYLERVENQIGHS